MSVELLGVGLAVLSAAALAGQSLAVRWSSARQSIPGIIGVVFLVNLLVLLPATAALYYPDFGVTTRSVTAFAMGGVLGSLLARASLFVGIERLGASRAEPLKSTFPLVAVGGAVVVLGEPLSLTLVVGVALLVVSG